ncbi:MAG: FHA domain-containing protein [Planctomycetes bacterium]|nr:FHA domain-containing protein [Planctomycetota bacterium]
MPELVLWIEEPGEAPREVVIKSGMRLGRDPASDVAFGDQNVSSRHALIVEVDGQLMIEDLGSSNKTRVRNGPALGKGDRHPLTPGLELGIGRCRVRVAIKEPPKKAIPRTEEVPKTGDFARTEAQPIHPYAVQSGESRTGSEKRTESALPIDAPGPAAPASENRTEQKGRPTAKEPPAVPSSEDKTEGHPIAGIGATRAQPRSGTSTQRKADLGPAGGDAPGKAQAGGAPVEAAAAEATAKAAGPKAGPPAEEPAAAGPADASPVVDRPAEATPPTIDESAPPPTGPAAGAPEGASVAAAEGPLAGGVEPTVEPPTTPATAAEAPSTAAAPVAAPDESAAPPATPEAAIEPKVVTETEVPVEQVIAPPAQPASPTGPEAPGATGAGPIAATETPAAAKPTAESVAAAPAQPATPVEEAAAPATAAESAKPAPAKAAPKAPAELPPMRKGKKEPHDFSIHRYEIDLGTYAVKAREIRCADHEDVLGGIARGFKILQDYEVEDAYHPKAPLVMNLGLLSGTQFMTGLRTFFHGYSPLKASHDDRPSAMWTAGSGKFGTKIRYLGIDEIVFTGRAVKPVYLHISKPEGSDRPKFSFKPADGLVGQTVNHKIQHLHAKYPEAHFAVIGPAGENYEQVRYAAIALSTINQLRSGDMKSRFCGRGGFGGVMGSKNLVAIVADVKDEQREKVDGLKEMNMIVARGEGSRRFRDQKKGDGGGGTWANMAALDPLNAMPENNFNPTGSERSRQLWRPAVEEKGDFLVKDEACFACGIACHKNIYENDQGKPGVFRAKFDYEPLNLLSANIGIYDIGQAATLVELVDDLCMDSISIGVTLAYAMEYNRRMKEAGETSLLPDYVRYGDFEGARRAIEEIGHGRLPVLGQGSKRLSEGLGETDFAMHCKGVEFPAYMPHVNPGYPWALAGGHMSMRTYLLYVFEKEKGLDYWVDAITTRGPMIMRDDVLGVCKFSAMCDEHMAMALGAIADLDIDEAKIREVVRRTFLRGYRLEKKQGFDQRDYVMPADALKPQAHLALEHFNTPEFFDQLRTRVTERFEKMLIEEGL